MSKRNVRQEQITKEKLIDEVVNSDKWLVISSTDTGMNVRAKSPESLTIIAEFLEADRDFFKMVCQFIKEVDDVNKAKMN